MAAALQELYGRLNGDSWRLSHPFNEDLLQANALMHNAAATEEEVAECVTLWCHRRQACQFGIVAASQARIHLCLLPEEALAGWSDEEISEKIVDERRLWKQRAAFEPELGAHSFIIVAAAPHVAFAAPDKHLRAFAERVLSLAGWHTDRRVARLNTVTSDYLYLRDPSSGQFFGFQFNVDFFACAGDGRWWHDHRFPGGIAFTANSPGHMMRFRQWYQGKDENEAWALKQAMLTIDNAVATKKVDSSNPREQGRATWLRSLDEEGKPLMKQVACPLIKVPGSLAGKDWTRYEGVLHTDHAVREEFFYDRQEPPTASRPYLMDFTYLYERSQPDFEGFSGGKHVALDDIFNEIGRPEDWKHRKGHARTLRSDEEALFVAEQLQQCQQWPQLPSTDDPAET
jgi:hypothetical protein